jgi:hypothetical protein
MLNIYDRIKETSYTIGTGNIVLNGAVASFSTFDSVYDNGDNLFYAVTDGVFYEVGSGVFATGIEDSIKRFPFRSSNSNAVVNFGEGLKEVFATYTATHSVFNGSGLHTYSVPQESGVAFWASDHIINYDSSLLWDTYNKRLGILKNPPQYAIDIGGRATQSIIRSSGILTGSSGIFFPSGNNGDSSYLGGRQLAHYEPNVLNSTTGSNQVLELSGVAKNNILFKKQNAGLVFAGPASGCTPPCSPDYPSFRPLLIEDIQDVDISVVNNGSGLVFDQKLGVNTSRLDGNVSSYTNQFDPLTSGNWRRASYVASGLYGGAITLIDTVATNDSGRFGYSLFTTSSGTNFNIGISNISGIVSNALVVNTKFNPSSVSGSALEFYGNTMRVTYPRTPASGNAAGNQGDICWDSGYLYVCISTNSWKRSALSSW